MVGGGLMPVRIAPNPLIPAGSVAPIDRLLARMRTDWCVVRRPSSSVDPGGAPISGGYETVASLDCQVATPGRIPTEAVGGGRFGPEADYEIRLPRWADVRSDDVIDVNARTLSVVYAPEPTHGFERRVLVKASTSAV